MKGISEMFAEFSGVEAYDEVCDAIVLAKIAAVERVRKWRKDNPGKYRKLRRKCSENYRQKYPDKQRQRQARARAKNPELYRRLWRKAQANRRAKLRKNVKIG